MYNRIKMRPVSTGKVQSLRRSYNRAIDGDVDPNSNGVPNPYQSMYSQAFGLPNQQSI
jgi:hypothetical protein